MSKCLLTTTKWRRGRNWVLLLGERQPINQWNRNGMLTFWAFGYTHTRRAILSSALVHISYERTFTFRGAGRRYIGYNCDFLSHRDCEQFIIVRIISSPVWTIWRVILQLLRTIYLTSHEHQSTLLILCIFWATRGLCPQKGMLQFSLVYM